MPQKSAPELFAVVHYLHRLSTEGKRGAKMALESCPKCHFIMLEGVLMTIEEHGQNGSIYVSDLAAAVNSPCPLFPVRCASWSRMDSLSGSQTPMTAAKRWCAPRKRGWMPAARSRPPSAVTLSGVMRRIPEEQREQLFSLTGVLLEAVEAENAELQAKLKGENENG